MGHKLFFSHNYQLTGVEAYMDMFFLTGEQRYLDAVLGAWALHRDPARGWILLGGSLAINEGDIYEPGSFHLEAGTNNAAAGPLPRERLRLQRGGHAHGHAAHGAGDSDGWGGAFPTGEFCGAVFWLKLNQRLHLLDPENVTFVDEIEREVFNEGLAHLAPDGSGIRYFSFLNGLKQPPANISTCCEGQGTRLYGSLQEYLFSLAPAAAGVYVDIYAPSTLAFFGGTLTVLTEFPYGSEVRIEVALNASLSFDLALRMPSWVAAPAVPVTVGAAPWGAPGTPGRYLHVAQAWPAGTTLVTFSLPMALAAHPYTGVTQLPPYARFGFTYGPTLLAATPSAAGAGAFNKTLRGMVIPGVDGAAPGSWMLPAADGNPLHWVVAGVPGVLFQPNWEVQQTLFSAFPCFESA